jgi:hypothetical protein
MAPQASTGALSFHRRDTATRVLSANHISTQSTHLDKFTLRSLSSLIFLPVSRHLEYSWKALTSQRLLILSRASLQPSDPSIWERKLSIASCSSCSGYQRSRGESCIRTWCLTSAETPSTGVISPTLVHQHGLPDGNGYLLRFCEIMNQCHLTLVSSILCRTIDQPEYTARYQVVDLQPEERPWRA